MEMFFLIAGPAVLLYLAGIATGASLHHEPVTNPFGCDSDDVR